MSVFTVIRRRTTKTTSRRLTCPSLRAVGVALALAASLAALPACGPSEEDVREEIEAARGCSDASECVDVGGYCPFGCSIAVNKSEADRIRELIEDHQASSTMSCQYDCMASSGLACEKGLCTAKFDSP